jgi:hypothetical protein
MKTEVKSLILLAGSDILRLIIHLHFTVIEFIRSSVRTRFEKEDLMIEAGWLLKTQE